MKTIKTKTVYKLIVPDWEAEPLIETEDLNELALYLAKLDFIYDLYKKYGTLEMFEQYEFCNSSNDLHDLVCDITIDCDNPLKLKKDLVLTKEEIAHLDISSIERPVYVCPIPDHLFEDAVKVLKIKELKDKEKELQNSILYAEKIKTDAEKSIESLTQQLKKLENHE